jgi:hypothetical protein
MIERITQTFMKDARDYFKGMLCGHVFKRKYVDENFPDSPSDDMRYGSFFEFKLSGALPKSKVEPKPEIMESVLKKKPNGPFTEEDWYIDYRRAKFNADYVKDILKKMGLEIVDAGKRITKGNRQGDLDLTCRVIEERKFGIIEWRLGDLITIDLKYSGLLYDKWEKYGWAFSDIQKEYHGTQAIQYHYLKGLPFYFLVCQNNNKSTEDKKSFEPPDIRFFHVPIDDHQVQQHIIEGNSLYENFKVEAKVGFLPRTNWKACMKCAIREGCPDMHTYPHPEVIDLTRGI